MSNLKFLTSPSLKGFVRSETDISCHCRPHVDLPNSNETFGRPQIHQFVKSDLSSYILSLIFAAANPGGEIFVRSFLSPFPQGSAVPFSSCSNSLGYASLITSLPPPLPNPPSFPNKIRQWHWLRCTKKLPVRWNYLCLMLRASVCRAALGRYYPCDGNSLRITALHPIWLHGLKRRHRAGRPLWIQWSVLRWAQTEGDEEKQKNFCRHGWLSSDTSPSI